MKFFLKNILPHLVAVVLFLILSMAFFAPELDGYLLRAGDTTRWTGMSKEIVDFRALNDEAEPLWTNSMFGGMPAYQISVVNKSHVGKWVLSILKLGFGGGVGTLFLAMISMYLGCLCFRIKPWVAIAAGAVFGLSSINMLYLDAGHASKVQAIALMPAVTGAFLLALRSRSWLAAIPFALFLSAQLAANHLQMTYYLFLLLLVLGITEGIIALAKKQVKPLLKQTAILLVMGVVATLTNAASILGTYEYGQHSTRGTSELTISPENLSEEQATVTQGGLSFDYMHQYSFAKGEALSILFPNVKGGRSGSLGNMEGLLDDENQTMAYVISNFPSYWGLQDSTGGAFYFGILCVLLFVLAIVLHKDQIKWGFLVIALLAIFLSWKEQGAINSFFFHYFPAYDKFRDTKMIFVILQCALPLLGFKWLSSFVEEADRKALFKPLAISAGTFLFIMLAFAATPKSFFDFNSPYDSQVEASLPSQLEGLAQQGVPASTIQQMQSVVPIAVDDAIDYRVAIFKEDAWRSVGFVLVMVLLLLALCFPKIPALLPVAALLVLSIADQWSVDRRYVNSDKQGSQYFHYVKAPEKRMPHAPAPADEAIYAIESAGKKGLDQKAKAITNYYKDRFDVKRSSDKTTLANAARFGALNSVTNYRVLNLGNSFNDARTSYFHKSIGGYHGAKLKRYQELINFHLSNEIQEDLIAALQTLRGPSDAEFRARAQDLGILNMLNTKYFLGLGDQPLPNPAAAGNAWFAEEVQTLPSADEVMTALGEINPTEVALVQEKYGADTQTSADGVIEMKSYAPNEIVYTAETASNAYAVFSEIYYPDGWQAYLDGQAVDHFPTNYVLRGMNVPAGAHEIVFRFEPSTYSFGKILGLILSLILLAAAGFAAFKFYKQSSEVQHA